VYDAGYPPAVANANRHRLNAVSNGTGLFAVRATNVPVNEWVYGSSIRYRPRRAPTDVAIPVAAVCASRYEIVIV